MTENKKQRTTFISTFNKYADSIYRFCFFRTFGLLRECEDLVQEAFIKLWRYLGQGEPINNMRALLYKIARNLIIDNYRKKLNNKEQSLDALLEEYGSSAEPSYDGKRRLETELELKETLETLEKMPPNHREVLTLRYVEGLTPKEMANVLETSPNNVSARIYRARKKLTEAQNKN